MATKKKPKKAVKEVSVKKKAAKKKAAKKKAAKKKAAKKKVATKRVATKKAGTKRSRGTFKSGDNYAAVVLGRRAILRDHRADELLALHQRAEALGRRARLPLVFAGGDTLDPREPGTQSSKGVAGLLLALGTADKPSVFDADVLRRYSLADVPESFYEELESMGLSFDVSTTRCPRVGLFLVAVNWSQAELSVGVTRRGRRVSVSNEDNTVRQIDSKLRRAIIRAGSGSLKATYC